MAFSLTGWLIDWLIDGFIDWLREGWQSCTKVNLPTFVTINSEYWENPFYEITFIFFHIVPFSAITQRISGLIITTWLPRVDIFKNFTQRIHNLMITPRHFGVIMTLSLGHVSTVNIHATGRGVERYFGAMMQTRREFGNDGVVNIA